MARRDMFELQAQVRGLSARIGHLEQEFKKIAPEPSSSPAPAPPAMSFESAQPPAPARLEAPRNDPPTLIDALAARRSSVRPAAKRPPNATVKEPEPVKLEWLVGGRIYAILGAVVVIAGVGLFLKLAWDRGWFAVLPDAWKCILSAAFGGVLLVAGEVLRKRWGALASIGCSAAGLGVIYASAYAAYAAFELVSHHVGFAMLAAVALLGVFIGARARLVSVAIVSLLGGYLAPFLFLDAMPSRLVLPAYLATLLLVGLTLCARLGGRFVAARSIVWWGTVVIGGMWTLANAKDMPWLACAFLVTAWGAIQGELIFSATHRTNPPGVLTPDPSPTRARLRMLSVSMSTSAWAGFLGGLTMHWWLDAAWMATGAGFAATAVLALCLAGHLRALRDAPENDRERLGAVFVAQAGVFLIVTVALGLAGWMEVVAWIAMGVAAIIAGRWTRARRLDVYGIVTLSIASLRLALFDKAFTPSLSIGADLAGLFLTRWSAMMALCALAWIGTGELIRRTSPARSGWIGGAIAMQVIGVVTLALAPLDERTSAVSIAWLWATFAGIAFLIGALSKRPEWRWFGVAALAPALLAAFSGYSMWRWTDVAAPPLAHGAWWFAVACAAGWLTMGRWMARAEEAHVTRSMGTGVMSLGGLAMFAATTLEVARVVPQITDTLAAQRAAVSIWWGLCAVGLLAAGFFRRNAPIRHVGLTLLGIATAKAVIFDLIEVSPGWRVASFVLLGMLMIGVAAAYTRLSSVLNAFDPTHSADDTGVTTPSSAPEAIAGE